MTEHLLRLPDADLQELVKALRANRLEAPYTPTGVHRIVSSLHVSEIAVDLQALADQGFSPSHIATTVELMAKARSQRPLAEDLIDLVTTGPEAPGVSNRDTSVVVRELFAHAEQSVLVAGYAVYQGQRVFQVLADRMEKLPALKVRMFLDVQRGPGETSASREIVRCFVDRFRATQWPKEKRQPEVYYDPRALELTFAEEGVFARQVHRCGSKGPVCLLRKFHRSRSRKKPGGWFAYPFPRSCRASTRSFRDPT